MSADPALDLFNPDNGPPYGEPFLRRYRAAQRARNHRITDWAQASWPCCAAACRTGCSPSPAAGPTCG